jgi:hypothetical protein
MLTYAEDQDAGLRRYAQVAHQAVHIRAAEMLFGLLGRGGNGHGCSGVTGRQPAGITLADRAPAVFSAGVQAA